MPRVLVRLLTVLAVMGWLCSGLLACQSASNSGGLTQADGVNTDNPMRWVTYSRQPMGGRQAAVQRMLANNPERFWADCAAQTRQIDDWPMIRLLAKEAETNRDARALPWLVRSWAMESVTVQDDDRPERRAIETIAGRPADGPLKQIVFQPTSTDEHKTQVAAWSVLARIESDEILREMIAQVQGEEPSLLLPVLKRVAPAVDVLPADRIAVAQMMRMAVTYDPQYWADWTRWREAKQGDGPATLELRHLPTLAQRDTNRDNWLRQRWLDHVSARLSGRQHVARGEGAEEDLVVTPRPDRFVDYVEVLGIADLMLLDVLFDVIEDKPIVRAFFEQAEADRLDTSTEYGGALGWKGQGSLDYRPYKPLIRRHDQAYVASIACMEAVYLGLAHVHFHTQRYDNAAWAGPGKGDLEFAESQHVSCVVLTFIAPNTLNIDAYFPGGVIIDLGCITR